jgi:hypothetical protein
VELTPRSLLLTCVSPLSNHNEEDDTSRVALRHVIDAVCVEIGLTDGFTPSHVTETLCDLWLSSGYGTEHHPKYVFDRRNLLAASAYMSMGKLITKLWKEGCDLEKASVFGYPLWVAGFGGNASIIEELFEYGDVVQLKEGALVYSSRHTGLSDRKLGLPISGAIHGGHLDIFDFLCSGRFGVISPRNSLFFKFVRTRLGGKNLDIFDRVFTLFEPHFYVLMKEWNKSCKGLTAENHLDLFLECAAESGHTDTVRRLLKKGASLWRSSYWALRDSVKVSDPDIVRMLLKHSSHLGRGFEKARRMVLSEATGSSFFEISHMLLEHGAPTYDETNLKYSMPVIGAIQAEHTELVRLLLRKGGDLLCGGSSELDSAIDDSLDSMVMLLIDEGANVDTYHLKEAEESENRYIVNLFT